MAGESLLDARARRAREEADRLHRIAQSAPPASSFEGRLQRWRDALADTELVTVWAGGEGLTSL